MVDLQKELRGVGARLTESEVKIYVMKAEVVDSKLYIGQLEREMAGMRAFLFLEMRWRDDYADDDQLFHT